MSSINMSTGNLAVTTEVMSHADQRTITRAVAVTRLNVIAAHTRADYVSIRSRERKPIELLD